MNDTAMVFYHVYFGERINSFLLGICLGVKLSDHLKLFFEDTAMKKIKK